MNMTFVKIDSTAPVTEYVVGQLMTALKEGKKVLWLLSGGSVMEFCVDVSKRLKGLDLSKLSVSLTDERFGPVGHADSNWQKLKDLGFELNGARLIPVLDGSDRDETTKRFGETLKQLLEESGYKLGIFGMGTDGHTAGIKPGSPSDSAWMRRTASVWDASGKRREIAFLI